MDASDLLHAPVLFAADATTGLPCVVLNVYEGTLHHLCGLHPTLGPLAQRLVDAGLVRDSAAIPPIVLQGTRLALQI